METLRFSSQDLVLYDLTKMIIPLWVLLPAPNRTPCHLWCRRALPLGLATTGAFDIRAIVPILAFASGAKLQRQLFLIPGQSKRFYQLKESLFLFRLCDDSVSSAGSLGDCTVDRGEALDKFDSEVFTMSYFF